MSALKSPVPLQEPDPVLDYISTMSDELAQLVRSAGDTQLALVLDLAATFAERSSLKA